MSQFPHFPARRSAVAVSLALVVMPLAAQTTVEGAAALPEIRVLGTAEEELKQAPGVSTITSEDLEKRPPANDLSEIIRTMPGVNLTGNSSSGAYGNQRQIDLRGMGPENTLILIDGKPVSSRDSVRMGRNGERNTRGDSNWVPVEAVERIEVLRGPAAARYGSGASGGVVNIITKKPTDKLSGSVTLYALHPQDGDESNTRRLAFNLAGPLSEKFSFRLYGSMNKTTADDPRVNAPAYQVTAGTTLNPNTLPPAGREGVRNRDLNGLLRWDLAPGHVVELESGVSRQGNIYSGERLLSDTASGDMNTLAQQGAETNTMWRRNMALTHRGNYGEGRTSNVSLSFDRTDNRRAAEGLAGGGEGSLSINKQTGKPDMYTNKLENWRLAGEYNTPVQLGGMRHMLTMGFEHRRQKLDDPYSTAAITGTRESNAGSIMESKTSALFIEDNFEALPGLILTPGLRLDHHNSFGNNWSPSLNAAYSLTPTVTLKGGVARAFKAPNVYQLNPNYRYVTAGNGCPYSNGVRVSGPCYIYGNPDLKPETSINKEIGIAWDDRGWAAGVTYFHNAYKNKIYADMGDQALPDRVLINGTLARPFKWYNAAEAVVQGLEGHFNMPILGENGDRLKLINNFTYMVENKNKATDQPLSVIPRFTINSTLDWRINPRWSTQLTATFYGKQKPRTWNTANNTDRTGANNLNGVGTYSLWGISTGYEINKNFQLRAGINNLFDKRLYRQSTTNSAGAATYNEPGRAFFVSLTGRF